MRWLKLDDAEVKRQLVRYSDQFRAAGAPPAEAIRRRMRRRRIRLAAVTGAAATMLAAGAAVAVAAILPAGHPARPSATQHQPAASPLGWVPAGPQLPASSSPQAWPFVVWLPGHGTRHGVHANVTDWVTGASLGQISPPGARCFEQVMGAADDRTYLLAAYNCNLSGGTLFYELRLTATGHPTPLIPISLPQSVASSSAWLALAPDGAHLAYAPAVPGRPNQTAITVVDLMSGKKRTWSGPGRVTTLGWADRYTLDFGLAWNGAAKPAFQPAVRALDTSAAGRSLLAARVLPAFTDVQPADTTSPLPGANGVSYGITGLIVDHGRRLWNEIARYSALAAKPTVIFRPWLLIGHNYAWCDPLWTDASGTHALAVCGTPNYGLQIDGDHIQKVALHFTVGDGATPAGNVFYFAF
jgi:hypothetical protein